MANIATVARVQIGARARRRAAGGASAAAASTAPPPAPPAADAAAGQAAVAAAHRAHVQSRVAGLEALLAATTQHQPAAAQAQALVPAEQAQAAAQAGPSAPAQQAPAVAEHAEPAASVDQAGAASEAGAAAPGVMQARVAAHFRRFVADAEGLSTEKLLEHMCSRGLHPPSPGPGLAPTRAGMLLFLAQRLARVPPLHPDVAKSLAEAKALPYDELIARMVANGMWPAPEGQAGPAHTADALGALLSEFLAGQEASTAPPALASVCFSVPKLAFVRYACQSLMIRHNGVLPPVGTVLSRSPGGAAVAAGLVVWFSAAWTRYGRSAA